MQQKHSPFVKSEYLHIYLASVYQTQSKTDFKFPLIDSLMLVPFKLASYLTKLNVILKNAVSGPVLQCFHFMIPFKSGSM